MATDNSTNTSQDILSQLSAAHLKMIDVDTMLNVLWQANVDDYAGHMCELILERNGIASGMVQAALEALKEDGAGGCVMTAQVDANALMKCRREYLWGWIAEYVGTRENLLLANIVGSNAFVLPKSGSTSGTDEYGDRYYIKRLARGRFKVDKWYRQSSTDKWSPKYGMLSDVDLGPILSKFAR